MVQKITINSTVFLCSVPSQVGRPGLTRSVTSGRPALIVTWTAIAGEHPNIRYQVQYRISGSASWSTKDVMSTSTTLKNLTVSTSYQVRVRAVSDVGGGSYSEISENVTVSCKSRIFVIILCIIFSFVSIISLVP